MSGSDASLSAGAPRNSPSEVTIDLLRQLVAFDTTSRNSNLELIDFIRDWLDRYRVPYLLAPSTDGSKANLLATIGHATGGGVMLSGHSDVVPVDGQSWSTDPFSLTEIDERFYARGACDMKGFLAVVLAAVPAFAAARLSEPLHIAVTYDEEIGCLGVPTLIEAMRTMQIAPRLAIVGEPTSMRVAIGHKGARAFHAHFKGRAAHSSLAPLSVNAIEHAADLVHRLTELGRRFAVDGPFDNAYDVPHTTVHTGLIRGGTQVNIVPAECDVEFEYRPLPDQDEDAPEAAIRSWIDDDIVPAMQSIDTQCGVHLERRYAYPGLATDRDAEVSRMTMQLTRSFEPVKIAFGTEAGCYHADLGTPSVVCGPGSIQQAHQRDEYVEASQLAECEAFMHRLLDRMRANDDAAS